MQLLALRFLGGVRKGLPAEAQGCPSLWAHRRAQQRDRWPARAQRSLRPGAVAVGLRTRAAPAAGRRLHVLGRAPLREPGSPDFPRRTRALRDRSARRVPEDFESGRCPMPSGRYYARRPRPDDPRRRTRDPTITPNAERWLEELQDEWSGLPDPIRSVAACVRQMENADGAEGQTPRARGRSGRWLVIHGSLTGERDGRATGTAIMLEEAKPSEIAPLIVRAYGLSDCETNITRLIPRVYRSGDRGRGLCLPLHDPRPLMSIFDKVGVRSCRELGARILDQYCLPRFGHGDNPPEPDGVFAGFAKPCGGYRRLAETGGERVSRAGRVGRWRAPARPLSAGARASA